MRATIKMKLGATFSVLVILMVTVITIGVLRLGTLIRPSPR